MRVADPDSHPEQTLTLLTRIQMADHLIDALWKSDFVDRQVREVLARLFALEPDPSLVRLLRAKASGLSPSEVRASLGRLRASFDFPVVVARPAERIAPATEPARARTGPPAAETLSPKNVGDGTPWRHVTLAMLIDAGLVSVPLDIEHRYRGTKLTGRIEDASRTPFGGVFQGTLSMAGAVARQSPVCEWPSARTTVLADQRLDLLAVPACRRDPRRPRRVATPAPRGQSGEPGGEPARGSVEDPTTAPGSAPGAPLRLAGMGRARGDRGPFCYR